MPIFFDKHDYELLRLINMVLERDRTQPAKYAEKLLEPNLHPHGIKELGLSHDKRIAYAVINLLESLQVGLAEDRLIALKALHDEVLFGTITNFKFNTGRVLIQIMKEIIRAHGDMNIQLQLAHDFRLATSGQARVIRSLLERYYLLEMPESWDQHAFDEHVHDANTKGRKSPTHLIMDAWIKGIRYLTVIYYNYVQASSVSELMRAADIMGMTVTIGVEVKGRFRGRYVELIWQPTGFSDYQDMLMFLDERPTQHLMRMGQEASRYQEKYVFSLLERYNESHRLDMESLFGITLPTISPEEFISFVGIGQPSLLHLSELVYKHCLPGIEKRHKEITSALPQLTDEAEKSKLQKILNRICTLDSSEILDHWLSRVYNTDLPDPDIPRDAHDLPEIMYFSVDALADWLTSIRPNSRLTLSLPGLNLEDVIEILYNCEGMITHLELFNLKYYHSGDAEEIDAINKLQLALNSGNSVAVKRIALSCLRKYRGSSNPDLADKAEKLSEILRHIQRFTDYYKTGKLETSIGSDSTSRSNRQHGMGFVNLETLPLKALKEIRASKKHANGSSRMLLPLYEEVNSRVTSVPHRSLSLTSPLVGFLRRTPGLRYFLHYHKHDWVVHSSRIAFNANGNISTLGGVQKDALPNPCRKPDPQKHLGPRWSYMNTSLRNVLKVLVGFSVALLTFQYTQNWWLLAWLGAPIWFGITGLRNIVQAVLGGGGIRRSPLLRWNNFVSWNRLCDSLMYTGFSVPLLELLTKNLVLQNICGITPANAPWLFFAIMSVVNGLYICSHNIYRGFPATAIVGNFFRSIFAVPVAILYGTLMLKLLAFFGSAAPELVVMQIASIISKVASDTVAGLIEGLADRGVNIRVRYWDYNTKLHHLFNSFSRLEILMPEEESVLNTLSVAKEYDAKSNEQIWLLEKDIIIDSLDFMYFWMYQPRSRPALRHIMYKLTKEERHIFCRAQYILTREKEVSQLMVDGMIGSNFAKPLSFYLGNVSGYLEDMRKITKVGVLPPEQI